MNNSGETTARVLTTPKFYTLAHKERILPKLKQELEAAMPDPCMKLDLRTAEQLPWLVSRRFA